MTEDDAHGGLEKVLVDVLEEFGLPPEAGLTGLLRHLQGNRVLNDHLLGEHIILLQSQLADFVAGVRRMMAEGTIVDLVLAARRIGALEELREPGSQDETAYLLSSGANAARLRESLKDARGITNTTLVGFVTGVKESFPQYDEDHRHVPKPEQKEDHDEGR